jgi:preprotein translocase SecE subunit
MVFKKKQQVDKAVEPTSKKPKADKKPRKGLWLVLTKIGHYFKESWQELKLVRWPDRKSTWKMTAAVVVFTAFFMTLIVLLDGLFDWLFKLIIK